MGNRATVIFTDGKRSFSPAVYLHWNGGAESVYGFLEELNRRKVRADQEYEVARFVQLVGEFFDQDKISGLSLGITDSPKSDSITDLLKVRTDHGDNGFYLINRTNGNMTVRRLVEKYIGDGKDYDIKNFTLVEYTPEQVDTERKQADEHKYHREFRDFYAKLTANKEIEAS